MMSPDRLVPGTVPDPVQRTLRDFEEAFDLELRLTVPPSEPGAAPRILYRFHANHSVDTSHLGSIPGTGILHRLRHRFR